MNPSALLGHRLVARRGAAVEQEETRGPVRLRALAVVMSLGGLLVAVLILGGITAGGSPLTHHVASGPGRVLLTVAQWLVLAILLLVAIATLYRFRARGRADERSAASRIKAALRRRHPNRRD
ncbi:hypothetical protein FRACA_990015 [Frankia canadensis]|uniref:Uncharacterized protein n=1 Tax=Frankia canadensis TaxID=1836972 RepID=A0A2I2L2Z3_9ACTN|nr:hypothetical protein [Frankia canadensis]SNQ52275.1 hypothetical protein FRACA_990015 [Frankia canadensis]SOU59565.1 hypothetical protein FRACA_990015 [Frankia canadensis]